MKAKVNIKRQQVATFFELKELAESGFKSLFATKDLSLNTVLLAFEAEDIEKTPTRFTLQKGENQHIVLKPSYLRYTNHSCDPNVFFDTTKMELIALRNIKEGEELRFFYPSTEWDMEEAFDCLCGSSNCLQTIKGATHLTTTHLAQYKLSDFVIEKHKNMV